ncbi:hypothetical protein, partial [Spirosoma flavus]
GAIVGKAARAIEDARMEFAKSEANRIADLAQVEIQTTLLKNGQTLAAEREAAKARIDLEEKTQKALLDIELKYNQISQADYDKRLALINEKKIADNKALNDQIAEQDRANRVAMIDAELQLVRDGSKKELELTLSKLKEKRTAAIKAAKEDKAAIDAINRDFDAQEIAAVKKHYKAVQDQIIDIAHLTSDALGAIIDASTARQISALDQQYEAILSSAALTNEAREKYEREYDDKKKAIEHESGERRRKLATFENAINTATAVIRAFADLGPIGGAIASALIVAKSIATQVQIDNAKYEQGGIIDGPSHKQGGVKARVAGRRMIELEGGEAIINKRSTALFGQQLSQINAYRGFGKPFQSVRSPMPNISAAFGIGPINPAVFQNKMAYGGIIANTDTNAIAEAVIKGLQRTNISVAVTDIRRVDKDMRDAEAGGDTYGSWVNPRR